MRNTLRLSTILFAVLAVSFSFAGAADAAIGYNGIEAKAGLANGENSIGTALLLGATVDLGEIAPGIGLEGSVDFWTKGYDIGGFGGSSEWRFTNIAFIGGARYNFPGSGLAPFAFGGLGLHIARASGEFSYFDPMSGQTVTNDSSNTDMEFGMQFGAGAEFGVTPLLKAVARVGYNINGGADYFFLTGGIRF
ncbi:MAG: outer membrane beta-barrel protein [Candidatus Eisenbacteria sp.]|nr:outer membrane beta-barrel protein [Candidatus Eisenbacteria bacterium]